MEDSEKLDVEHRRRGAPPRARSHFPSYRELATLAARALERDAWLCAIIDAG